MPLMSCAARSADASLLRNSSMACHGPSPQSALLTASPAIRDALRAQPALLLVGSHIVYKQLRCLLHGNILSEGCWPPLTRGLSAKLTGGENKLNPEIIYETETTRSYVPLSSFSE